MRCRSGFCAQSTDQCIELYGYPLEVEQVGQPSALCNSEEGPTDVDYFRCEDGICRPGIYNEESQVYESACLSFMGCGLLLPYQCPNGKCVSEVTECKTYGKYCSSSELTPYQCKDLTCVASPQ